jgi:hypothetical protein
LCPGQHRVEQRTAGVGVDLDQSEAAFGDVKVVAEEHALRASGIVERDRGRRRENLLPIGRQRDHRLDSLHYPTHARHVRVRQKHGTGREQVWTALLEQLEQTGLVDLGRQRKPQRCCVQGDAEAFAVKHLHRFRYERHGGS